MSKQTKIADLKRRINDVKTAPQQFFENSEKFLNESDLRRAARQLVEGRKDNASFARAIKRATLMLEASPFWQFDGKTLRIVSDKSGVEYRGITANACICESWLSNHGFCKHRAICLILEAMEQNR